VDCSFEALFSTSALPLQRLGSLLEEQFPTSIRSGL
jgi:hypothetical protein